MNQWLFLSLLTALFGWFLTWLLIKGLFFPQKTWQIGNFKWESSLLKWARSISPDVVVAQWRNKPIESVFPLIEEHLDDFFRHKLKEKMPIVSMFIGEKTVVQLKEVFFEELNQLFPMLVNEMATKSKEQLLLNFQSNWLKRIEKEALNSTLPLRIAGFVVGFLWGIFMQLVIHCIY